AEDSAAAGGTGTAVGPWFVLPALVAWAAGAIAAWILHQVYPGSVDAVLGFGVAALVYGAHLLRARHDTGTAAMSTPVAAEADRHLAAEAAGPARV
ncbi:hypothetical protein, partial [Streptomyces sp. NPDC060198]|uniref:hypothetical protein n=1 Tax=Streptomyces sp. NPDC060198 TaxID=3347070 RepID=UPI0036512A41